MTFNWKRLAALLLAVMLTLSLTALGEDEIINSDDLSVLEDIELSEPANDLDLPDLNLDLQEPVIDEIITPEEDIDAEVFSNALVKKVKIGVKEKYTIDTSSLSGKLTFTSSKAAVATVTKKGVITGKKVGTAKITIKTSKGKKYTVTVTVAKAPSKVTLNKKTATLEIGDTLQLKATLPSKTASNKITWTSSNKNVATVSNKGKVTAKGEGTATITVKTFNGKKARCKVTVVDEQAPVLSADPTSISIEAGKSQNVRITYLNDNTIVWKVSNSDIATCQWIDGWDGDTCQLTITGLSAGSATVTVYDETTQDYVDIHVNVYGQVEKITELSGLMFKTIPEANAMLDLKLTYYEENMYTCDYFSVLVDSKGKINTVGFFNNYGAYTLMGQWPGRSLSNAANSLFNMGFKLQSDVDQLGTFTHPDLPGCKLLLKYSNSKVDYLIFGTTSSNVSNFF